MSPLVSIRNRRYLRRMPDTNSRIGDHRGRLERQILHFVCEAIRFFPAFARAAFCCRDFFSSLSMVRTRESGIPKFFAAFSAETLLLRIRAGRRMFKFYTGLRARGENWRRHPWSASVLRSCPASNQFCQGKTETKPLPILTPAEILRKFKL